MSQWRLFFFPDVVYFRRSAIKEGKYRGLIELQYKWKLLGSSAHHLWLGPEADPGAWVLQSLFPALPASQLFLTAEREVTAKLGFIPLSDSASVCFLPCSWAIYWSSRSSPICAWEHVLLACFSQAYLWKLNNREYFWLPSLAPVMLCCFSCFTSERPSGRLLAPLVHM